MECCWTREARENTVTGFCLMQCLFGGIFVILPKCCCVFMLFYSSYYFFKFLVIPVSFLCCLMWVSFSLFQSVLVHVLPLFLLRSLRLSWFSYFRLFSGVLKLPYWFVFGLQTFWGFWISACGLLIYFSCLFRLTLNLTPACHCTPEMYLIPHRCL